MTHFPFGSYTVIWNENLERFGFFFFNFGIKNIVDLNVKFSIRLNRYVETPLKCL